MDASHFTRHDSRCTTQMHMSARLACAALILLARALPQVAVTLTSDGKVLAVRSEEGANIWKIGRCGFPLFHSTDGARSTAPALRGGRAHRVAGPPPLPVARPSFLPLTPLGPLFSPSSPRPPPLPHPASSPLVPRRPSSTSFRACGRVWGRGGGGGQATGCLASRQPRRPTAQ